LTSLAKGCSSSSKTVLRSSNWFPAPRTHAKSIGRNGLSEEETYDIDLTPPPEPLTILEELAEWGVELTWQKPTEDNPEGGLWYLTNTYTENMFDDWAIGHLVDDEDGQLTSRDREAGTPNFFCTHVSRALAGGRFAPALRPPRATRP
ncbi:hypothetical protein LCGC14_2795250, partial [marine sediment metagenome]